MKRPRHNLADLRYLTPFPRRYKPPGGRPLVFWDKVMSSYGDTQKGLAYSGYRWRVICFDDGRKELAYLKVRAGGLLTGKTPAIYRGIIIPRLLTYATFAHIKSIRLAF